MPQERVTKTFTITASTPVMQRFERFLALLGFSSAWGHSATFAMPLDGDGADRFKVHDFPSTHAKEAELIGGVGRDCEIALTDGYTTKDFAENTRHYLVKDRKLLRDGQVIKEADDTKAGG